MSTIVEAKRPLIASPDKDPLLEALWGRNEAERFKDWEKAVLAERLPLVWPDSSEFPREGAEWLDLSGDECAMWGVYPDGERYVHLKNGEGMRGDERSLTYMVANLETDIELTAVKTIINETESNEPVILGTAYFPYGRGDRPILMGDGWRNLVFLKTPLKELAERGLRGMGVVDSHSPAFAWYALRYGLGVLDLTAMPMMIEAAKQKGLFDNGDEWRVVVGDDGAREYGQLVSDLMHLPPHIQGSKDKEIVDGQWKTNVTYTTDDLRSLEGKSVIMPEDIISTGGTMEAVINIFMEAGVSRVVIVATYPIFAEGAVERLVNRDRVEIVTTDGREPLNSLDGAVNVTKVRMVDNLRNVLELDYRGIDYWSEQGHAELMKLGFCLSPWQVYNGRI